MIFSTARLIIRDCRDAGRAIFFAIAGNPPTRRITLAGDKDNALYVRITFEDGHFAWSSPIYIFR